MIMAPVRSPAYHQRSYVEKRGATVENLPGEVISLVPQWRPRISSYSVQSQSFQNKSDGPLQRKLMSYISFGVGDIVGPEGLLDHMQQPEPQRRPPEPFQ